MDLKSLQASKVSIGFKSWNNGNNVPALQLTFGFIKNGQPVDVFEDVVGYYDVKDLKPNYFNPNEPLARTPWSSLSTDLNEALGNYQKLNMSKIVAGDMNVLYDESTNEYMLAVYDKLQNAVVKFLKRFTDLEFTEAVLEAETIDDLSDIVSNPAYQEAIDLDLGFQGMKAVVNYIKYAKDGKFNDLIKVPFFVMNGTNKECHQVSVGDGSVAKLDGARLNMKNLVGKKFKASFTFGDPFVYLTVQANDKGKITKSNNAKIHVKATKIDVEPNQ